MAKFEYKGADVGNLITPGGSTVPGFDGLVYTAISNYTTELPLKFNLEQGVTDISTLMTTKFVEFTATGPSQYEVPGDFNKIRALVIGGGGGGAGGGGCGVSGSGQPQSRQSGGPGGHGRHGGFIYLTDTVLSGGRTIQYLVGAAGGSGGGGQNVGNTGQANSQPGQPGQAGGAGQVSSISFGNVQVVAPTSNSAPGGPGGPGTGTPGGANILVGTNPYVPTTNGGSNFLIDGDDATAIPGAINPLSFKSTYGYGGDGGGRQPDGDGYRGQDGTPGYIRIYLLKD